MTLVGHGVPNDRIEEAFRWAGKLFALPHEEKMKAPHLKEAKPHRGYSVPGNEKRYSKAQATDKEVQASAGEVLDKINDVWVNFARIPGLFNPERS